MTGAQRWRAPAVASWTDRISGGDDHRQEAASQLTGSADGARSPELEAIAAAAHDRLHAQAGQDPSAIDQAACHVADAASAAITAGARLSAIADAEHDGELRARQELSGEVLRQLTRAAKRKHDADTEYEHAITRAGRLGLSHREIAAAAQVSHGSRCSSAHRAE